MHLVHQSERFQVSLMNSTFLYFGQAECCSVQKWGWPTSVANVVFCIWVVALCSIWVNIRDLISPSRGLTSSCFTQTESKKACGKFVSCKGKKKTNHFFTSASFFCTGSRGSHSAVLFLDQQKVSVVFTLRLVFGTNIATCIETHSESITEFAHCRSKQQHALKYFNYLYTLFMSKNWQQIKTKETRHHRLHWPACYFLCLLVFVKYIYM